MRRVLGLNVAPVVVFVGSLATIHGSEELALPALAWWWSIAIMGAGLGWSLLARWDVSAADIGATVCQGMGLLGTAVGFMIMLASSSLEATGIYTALSTTVVGLAVALLLYVQHWLLRDVG